MRRPRWYDYDSDLQMLRQLPKHPNMKTLEFLRWSLIHARTKDDGWVMSAPSGPYAPTPEGVPQ